MIKVPVPPIVAPVTRHLAAASLLALTLGSAQAGIMVDDFTDDQLVRDPVDIGDVSTSNLPAGAFIGTSRDLTVTRNGPNGSSYAASNSVNPSILVIGNSGNATGIVTVQWNQINDLDFTVGGALGLYVAFANPIDHALTITFDVMDELVTASTTQTFPNLSQGGGFFFPFLSFSNAAVFKSVDTFKATFTSTFPNWDAGVSSIQATDVPVPGVLALMALGLTGLGVTRRRSA